MRSVCAPQGSRLGALCTPPAPGSSPAGRCGGLEHADVPLTEGDRVDGTRR